MPDQTDQTPAYPLVNPNTAVGTLPAGWRLCYDIPDGKKSYRRKALYRGPASSIDAADAALRDLYPATPSSDSDLGALLDLQHSRSAGSAVAEIEVSYSTASGTAGGEGEEEDPEDETVAPDTVTLTPQTVPVALASHPMFDGLSAQVVSIDAFIVQDKVADAVSTAAGNEALLKYIAMRLAGISTWNTTGYALTVVRHYGSGEAAAAAKLKSMLADTGKVFAWAAVEGADALGNDCEPKWCDAAGTANSYEWLLTGASPVVADGSWDITISYQGAWKWCSYLYSGGGWSPQLAVD